MISLAALAVLTSRLLPNDRNSHDDPPVAEHRPGRGWLTAVVLVLCVVALADMLCEGAAADWSAVYLRSSLNASGVILGLAYTLYSLVMVATRFAGSRLLAKWPRHRVLPGLTALATVGFAVGLAAHDTAITLIAFCCLGAGCALVIPTTYSTVGEMASANPGRAVALVSGIGWVGFVAGPPLIGQIASATSLRFALIVIPVLTALITGLMIATGVFTTGLESRHFSDRALELTYSHYRASPPSICRTPSRRTAACLSPNCWGRWQRGSRRPGWRWRRRPTGPGNPGRRGRRVGW